MIHWNPLILAVVDPLVPLFFTVCCSWFIGHVWASEINLGWACKTLPSSGQPGEIPVKFIQGKEGENIQMSNYPCSAVHETVTQLENLFHISVIHILFTR